MNLNDFLAAFLAAQALFALNLAVPGSNFVLISRASLTRGRSAGLAIALGASLGDMLFAGLALGGLAALASDAPALIQGVALCGGLWLGWMGLRMALAARSLALGAEEAAEGPWSARQGIRLGLGATLVNPQTVLFFSAVVAGGSAASLSAPQAGLMWAGFALVSLCMRSSIALLFSTRRARDAYARMKRPMNVAAGSALAIFGGKTAIKTMPFWAAKAHALLVLLGFAF